MKCQLGENPLNRSAACEMSRKAHELTWGKDIVYSPNKYQETEGIKEPKYGTLPNQTRMLLRSSV